mgnify:CR=1 FL=1
MATVYTSLSSWRAWIEIKYGQFSVLGCESLSSWRAWIEMSKAGMGMWREYVALLMESVD